jgi:hypothetical protein
LLSRSVGRAAKKARRCSLARRKVRSQLCGMTFAVREIAFSPDAATGERGSNEA